MNEKKKLAWLREVIGQSLPDLYDPGTFPGFESNGAGPARIVWKIPGGFLVPDWWPLTVPWRDRWKISASADLHDLLYWIGGTEDDRQKSDWIFRGCLIRAGQEIRGWPWLLRIRRNRMAAMARLYYTGVRTLGKGSFCYDQTAAH